MKLFRCLGLCFLLLLGCTKSNKESAAYEKILQDNISTSLPDHIIFVWLENKGYNDIIGSADAPYINSLIIRGTLFSNCHGTTRPSQPNYISFFAGTTNNVTNDACLDGSWKIRNLYTVLAKQGKSFAWYSEDLPEAGSKVCDTLYYRRKHNPTSNFANVPAKANKPFSLFPDNYNLLENVVCISPNMVNDMHDGSVRDGDDWIKLHLADLITWCETNNSVFVIYFDEGAKKDIDNHFPVVAVGEHVRKNFIDSSELDHYSWTKTVCKLFGAPGNWTDNLINKSPVKLLRR